MGACGGCGRNLAETAARCMYCGATKAAPKECPKCKRKLDPQAVRCVFCNVDFARSGGSGPDPRAVALARGELFQRAEQLRKAGQVSVALGLLEQILLADPKFVPAWLARGKCFAIAGNMLGARDAAQSALALDPSHAEARGLLETWAKAVGAMPSAALAAAATSVLGAAREANALLEAGRHAEALRLFDEMVSSIMPDRRDHPSLAALHTSRGIALQTLGRLPEALASFAEALRVNAGYALAWQNQASALDDAGRVKEAALSAERAVELDASRTNAWVDLGYYRKKLGQLRQAQDAYEQALALDPRHPAANINLGNVFAEGGDLDRAERAYRAALDAAPGFPPAQRALERLLAARAGRSAAPTQREAPTAGAPAGAPPGLPPGRPFKTAMDRAMSRDPADSFYTHALLELRKQEIPTAAAILAVGWICMVPGLPGAEILADILVHGPRVYACRSARGAAEATLETIGRVDLFAARDLLAQGILQQVNWVIDAAPSAGLLHALEEAEAVVGRREAFRVLRVEAEVR